MQQRLLGGEALLRVHHEQTLHQIETILRKLAAVLLLNRLGLRHIGELEADEARVFRKLLLLERRQGAQYLLDLEQLVDFTFTREQRFTVRQLSHDAANGPDVDLFGVAVRQQKLRTTVPASGHIVCHGWVLPSGRDAARETEITQLKII